MGMKKVYNCDICRDIIKNPLELFGVNFANNTQFTLGGYGSTEGVHICFRCAGQLKILLNNDEIEKAMSGV